MKNERNSTKSASLSPASRPNGRKKDSQQKVAARPNGGGLPAEMPGPAASDDAGGSAATPAPISIGTRGARPSDGAARPRDAEAAGPGSNDQKQPRKRRKKFVPGPGDEVSQMLDATDFVIAVSAHNNLVGVSLAQLDSEDEKVRQRMLEQLLQMAFGKGSAPPEEIVQVEVDSPRPNRR